jgi:hypothetical protein
MDRGPGAVGDGPDYNRLSSRPTALGDGGRSVAFSTAVAIRLVLLMEYDRPFVPGGFVISPADYRDAIPD